MEKKLFALMRKGEERLAVDPAAVSAHELDGWQVIGTAEGEDDGKATEIGKIIETPAHVIQAADGTLKAIPKFAEMVSAVIPPAVEIEAATKAEAKIKK